MQLHQQERTSGRGKGDEKAVSPDTKKESSFSRKHAERKQEVHIHGECKCERCPFAGKIGIKAALAGKLGSNTGGKGRQEMCCPPKAEEERTENWELG